MVFKMASSGNFQNLQLSCTSNFLEAPKRVPKQTLYRYGYPNVKFQNSKNLPFWYPIRFDTPLGAAKERHPNGYQNKRVPKRLDFRNQKTCHFDTPFVLIPLWVLLKFWYPFGRFRGVSQKTREGCGCFRGLFGVSRGKLRESPGKIAGKFFPNREMLQILGSRAPEGQTCREPWRVDTAGTLSLKNLLTPLFLMGCFPGDFREGKRPIKVGKRPIKEGKWPIKLNGLFSGTPLWRKTAPLKGPLRGLWHPTFRAGFSFEIDSSSLLEFFWVRRVWVDLLAPSQLPRLNKRWLAL